jgi:K+/H+ antiporter YhaU regulatory subunit KhtT
MRDGKQKIDKKLAEPLPVLAEIDNLISTAEARIEHEREYIRSVASVFGCSMQATADLEAMTSALEGLKRQRAQVVRWGEA